MNEQRIAQLSDAELRQQLIDLGVNNCGPVTASTRRLHEKKLMKLINEAGAVHVSLPSPDTGSEKYRRNVLETPPPAHTNHGRVDDDDLAGEESYEYLPETYRGPTGNLYPDLSASASPDRLLTSLRSRSNRPMSSSNGSSPQRSAPPAVYAAGGWKEWVRPALIAASMVGVAVFVYMFGARLAAGIPFDEEDDKQIEHFE